MKTKEEVLEEILSNTYHVEVNMNDTFGYACAESEDLDGDDLLDLVPFIQEYDWDAVVALVAIKQEVYYGKRPDPIRNSGSYKDVLSKLYKALDDSKDERFFEIRYKRDQKLKEIETFGEKVQYAGTTKEKGLQPQIHYLEKAGIYAIGSSWRKTRDELIKKFSLREI